ncbi:MAG: hypothetical protein HWE25_10700 [Alphaproteobacteria bacterium]|nr:hypothetical protein [Alphaproteobacteria bacterium]
MRKLKELATSVAVAVLLVSPVAADQLADEVVDQVVAAYGGKTLTDMKSLFVRDRYKMINTDGGAVPGEATVSRLYSDLSVDFETGQKSVKNWTMNQNGNRLGQIMFDGEKGWSVNHLRGSHVRRDDLNGDNVGAGMMRLLDATVVRSLFENRNSAALKEDVQYRGVPHYQLTFATEKGPEQLLYIDKSSGLVSKMIRGRAVYEFADHVFTDGIAYARDTNFLASGQPRLVTTSRSIQVNANVEDAFSVPKATKALEGMRDTSSMDVVSPAKGVYLAGKGFSASIFVDAGDYFVGAGGMGGIKDRLSAVQEMSGSDKPLRYQVIPEHHPGHNRGAKDIADLGAIFVTVENHVASIQDLLDAPLPDDRFLLVDGQQELADGKVGVYEIATIQSAQYLIFYVPSAKLVFGVDDFGTNLLNSVPSPDRRMISFRKAIEALDLDVEQFAHVHGTGLLTIDQLREVTDSYRHRSCPAGHSICAD